MAVSELEPTFRPPWPPAAEAPTIAHIWAAQAHRRHPHTMGDVTVLGLGKIHQMGEW
jgi:hypothetical protein